MRSEHNVQLAITEVVTKTNGKSVRVALSSQELSTHHRRLLHFQKRNKSPQRMLYRCLITNVELQSKVSMGQMLLSNPCHVDLSLKLEKFNPPTKRNEAWIYIEDSSQVKYYTGFLRLIRHLQPVHVVLEQPFQLTCHIEFSQKPLITWYRNGVELPLDGKNRSVELVDGKVVLNIDKSTPEDQGLYEVFFSTPFGKETSKAEVFVRAEHPRFLLPVETSYTAEIGDDVTTCYCVAGIPRPEITWSALSDDKKFVTRGFTVQNRVDVIGGVEIMMTSLKIKRVQVQHSKVKWVCRASNVVGFEELSAEIVSRGSVEIVSPLHSLRARRGGTATFRFKAVGWPRPEVTWYFADRPIASASVLKVVGTLEGGQEVVEGVLEIPAVTLTNEGIYTVTASNKWNSVSSQAILTVSPEAPEFTERFHDKTITEGTDLHLNAAVTGVPLPSIKWFRNDTILLESSTCVIRNNGETCSLIIKQVGKDQSGRYTCVAENETGLSKCVARIHVIAKTAGVLNPSDDQVFIERRKEIKETPITEQRREENSAAEADVVTQDNGNMLTSKDSPSCSCAGNNAEDEDDKTSTTNQFKLKEQVERPKFMKSLRDQEVQENEDCCFEIEIAGIPAPQMHWYKSEKMLSPSSSLAMISDGSKHTLVFKKVQLEHAGSYTVQAVNLAGKVFSSAILKVNEKQCAPLFIEELQNMETVEGESVCYECLVKGKPLPEITWFVDGVEAKRAVKTVRRSDLLISSFLVVDLPGVEDCGLVRAVARNMAGQASSTASLAVKSRDEKPFLKRRPANLQLREHEKCVFEATIVGKPQPQVEWLKNGIEITSLSGVQINQTLSNYSLTIDKVKLSEAGCYTVRAFNIAGETCASAYLSVKASKSFEHQPLKPHVKVTKPAICDANVVIDATGQGRVPAEERSNEHQLTFIRTTRMGAGQRLSTVVGEIEYRAEMSVEDCETEMVESPLLEKTAHLSSVVAEFFCEHDGIKAARLSEDGKTQVQIEETSKPGRWIVRKAYLNSGTNVKVEQWSVRSYVDCVEAMIDVSQNILDNVKFAQQNVEFRVMLSSPFEESLTWLKDGRPVIFTQTSISRSRVSLKPKYSPTTNESGLVHKLIVNNVTREDQGIYTLALGRHGSDGKAIAVKAASMAEVNREQS